MVMKRLQTLFIAYALTLTAVAAQTPEAPAVRQVPQVPRPARTPEAPIVDMPNAYQVRDAFQQLLRQYPPHLQDIFRLDPLLLTNPAFMAPYPNLAAFIAQHPEVAHSPGFFVGEPSRESFNDSEQSRAFRMFEEIMGGVAAFAVGVVALSVFCWILKTIIDHRRWLRVSKVQSDVHSKLLDRFTSNQDLLAYVQTSAGRHFLESAPISIDTTSRTLSAPLSRILFSVQAGVVLALAGLGLYFVSRSTMQEAAQPLYVVGMLAMALGIGFVLSALFAYLLSRRLGLLTPTPLTSASDNVGVSPPNA
jgi:hypothetical protein